MLPLLFSLLLNTSSAGELAGVTMPDSITVENGQKLVLNGMGLREMFWIDIYVGGLYLPTATHDPATVINSDVRKRMIMHFLFRRVTPQQVKDTFRQGILAQPGGDKLTAEIAQLEAMVDDYTYAGDEVILDYVPGVGTTITAKGKAKGTVKGVDVMKALFSIYVGAKPASEPLKQGLLGLGQ